MRVNIPVPDEGKSMTFEDENICRELWHMARVPQYQMARDDCTRNICITALPPAYPGGYLELAVILIQGTPARVVILVDLPHQKATIRRHGRTVRTVQLFGERRDDAAADLLLGLCRRVLGGDE